MANAIGKTTENLSCNFLVPGGESSYRLELLSSDKPDGGACLDSYQQLVLQEGGDMKLVVAFSLIAGLGVAGSGHIATGTTVKVVAEAG